VHCVLARIDTNGDDCSALRGMACLLVLVTPQAYSLVVGRERGRSIPFSEVAVRFIEVRLAGRSRMDLLMLSSSHFDPTPTFTLHLTS
jgi:hypothetical protein